jgi:hypothetical protein
MRNKYRKERKVFKMKKNVFSKSIAVLASMAVLGAASMMSASAAGLAVGSATAAAGESVTLPVSLVDVDGTSMGCVVSITYPEALEVSGTALPGNLAAQPAASNGDGTATVAATFVAPAGLATDFTSMTFVVPADAEDGTEYSISVAVDQFDVNGAFETSPSLTPGVITVSNPTEATEPETEPATEPETEPATEPETEPATDAPTQAPTTQAPTTEAPTTAKPKKTGSPKTGSAGVAVAVAGLVTAGATAVVLKKKN